VAGIAFALHMTNMVTADAVLDGRRSSSARRSTAAFSMARRRSATSSPVTTSVATVVAQVTDRRSVMSAEAEREEAGGEAAALDGERDRLTALQTQLQAEVSRFTGLALARANAEPAGGSVERRERRCRLSIGACGRRARPQRMIGTGSMGASEIDQRVGAEEAAKHKLAASEADLARLMVEAGAFASGINARDGQNDVPYSRQRLDEIAIRLNEVGSERAALVARDRGLAQEVVRESDWLNAQTRFESRGPGTGGRLAAAGRSRDRRV